MGAGSHPQAEPCVDGAMESVAGCMHACMPCNRRRKHALAVHACVRRTSLPFLVAAEGTVAPGVRRGPMVTPGILARACCCMRRDCSICCRCISCCWACMACKACRTSAGLSNAGDPRQQSIAWLACICAEPANTWGSLAAALEGACRLSRSLLRLQREGGAFSECMGPSWKGCMDPCGESCCLPAPRALPGSRARTTVPPRSISVPRATAIPAHAECKLLLSLGKNVDPKT